MATARCLRWQRRCGPPPDRWCGRALAPGPPPPSYLCRRRAVPTWAATHHQQAGGRPMVGGAGRAGRRRWFPLLLARITVHAMHAWLRHAPLPHHTTCARTLPTPTHARPPPPQQQYPQRPFPFVTPSTTTACYNAPPTTAAPPRRPHGTARAYPTRC